MAADQLTGFQMESLMRSMLLIKDFQTTAKTHDKGIQVRKVAGISVHGLSKEYSLSRSLGALIRHPFTRRERVRALQDVSFDVHPGEILGLIGPNGAGKTTLIKILANLILPDSGTVCIDGHDVMKHGGLVRSKVGYISSDERAFFWRLSGIENLKFFASLYELPNHKVKDRIRFLSDRFGLRGILHRRFGLYSSGQKKLLTVVRALVADPQVILMDEATNSLDPGASDNLMNFVLEDLVKGRQKTILWASHRLEEIRPMCDSVVFINHGRSCFSGDVDAFVAMIRDRGGNEDDELVTLARVFERLSGP